MKSDYRYSSGVCYNSFPLPTLTDKNNADLTRCAENILLAREAHFPATIADLYDPEKSAGSATTPNGWRSCSSFTPQCSVTRKVRVIGRV